MILQLAHDGKLVNKKFKGADSFFTIETKSVADLPQSPDPFFPVIQDTPLATQYPDKISNLQTGLHELRSNESGGDEIIHFRAVFINQAESKVS